MTAVEDDRVLAGVELGGTKVVALLARGDEIVERHQFPTLTPELTFAPLRALLRRWADEHRPAALGIASFGPLAIDPAHPGRGLIGTTPKPGWAGANVVAALAGLIDGPVALGTDVIAAALAEGRFGAAVGCRDFVYVTVGTGIGMGIIAGGRAVTGTMHPEAGHMRVARIAGDPFAGHCPYHGDCLEGLASGPAIGARAGIPGDAVADDDRCWRFVIDALAQGCANLLLTLASERIVLGGGVIVGRPWLAAAIEARMIELLGGYWPLRADGPMLRIAALGADAGPRGALLLASDALAQ